MIKSKVKKIIFIIILFLIFIPFGVGFSNHAETEPTESIPTSRLGDSLSPCPSPDREARIVYREKVIHQDRQFKLDHPGCGGDILMRKRQRIALQAGFCQDSSCTSPEWLEENEGGYVQIYDRYIPEEDGEVFEEVGSWQKAWPPTIMDKDGEEKNMWMTEEELEEEYGEPIPFPTCQSDCLQAPPGVPGNVGDFTQEDPYYFNNPWLPEITGGEIPNNIEDLREKNMLGGENPLNRVQLPTKLFWWNIPGWQDGWIEDGELKECEGPEDIACVHSYILRFDNINREDRPATFHRHEVINALIDNGFSYTDAQRKYEKILEENYRAYQAYRRETDDAGDIDIMRFDRDNIVGCDNCGTEKEIWLKDNTFNPLSFDPLYYYSRPGRESMKKYMLERFEDSEQIVRAIIRDVYDSYGRPGFFRSGAEHSYSLQASCYPHDYLEENTGRWGPEASFSFETSDSPELISPLDPNWTSPYDPKKYDPDFNPTRIKREKIGEDDNEDPIYYPSEDYERGYTYPAEKIDEDNNDYFEESEELSSLPPDYLGSIWNWNNSQNELLLQDQVAFRERLQWAQQWKQENPEYPARPPRNYHLSFGEGIRATQDNEEEYGAPVLEDCHGQLKEILGGLPSCSYITRSVGGHESQLRYPLPNHLDRETEFFTLPEDPKKDIYSWNVSSCWDHAGNDCTNFSQLWRFQLDEREIDRLFPPRNNKPLNLKDETVSKDAATVGFPLEIEWERRFGARSYVYRLAKEEDEEDEFDDIDNLLDVKVLYGRSIKYSISELEEDGLFDLDTKYVWDVRACWDENINHNKEDFGDIIDWVEENKKCSKWASEYYDKITPFEFKTTGRPPELEYPADDEDVEVPVEFSWESVPGANSYVFELKDGGFLSSNTIFITTDSQYVHEKSLDLFGPLNNPRNYDWKVASCVFSVENSYHSEEDTDDIKEKYHCGEFSEAESFTPVLAIPENLTPGNSSSLDPQGINITESKQVLRWDSVSSANYYQVRMNVPGPDEFTQIVSHNYFFYDFENLGSYQWEVASCLTEDCSDQKRSKYSASAYIKIKSAEARMGGIVPCGREANIFERKNTKLDSTDDCEIHHLFVMIGLIIEEILVKMIIPYSLVALLLYTAYLFYQGLGDPKTMQKVFKVWGYALKGYLLILLSWTIVGLFLTFAGYQFGAWWNFTNIF